MKKNNNQPNQNSRCNINSVVMLKNENPEVVSEPESGRPTYRNALMNNVSQDQSLISSGDESLEVLARRAQP